ncbi:MAG: Trm112 family protein [Planctomycetaceae bacterium]
MSFDTLLHSGILVCTKCHQALVRDGQALVCVAPGCRLKFEIRDEIPNMLLEDASPLAEEEWRGVLERAGREPEPGRG